MEPMQQTTSPCSVLLVEDDADNRTALSDLLEAYGFLVTPACNGLEALHLLRGGSAPHVILLDLAMPVMDGWEFCEHVRADAATSGIPVLTLSAMDESVGLPHPPHAAHSFIKPVDLPSLLCAMSSCCEKAFVLTRAARPAA